MRKLEKYKLEKFEREMTFMTENAADFPADSIGGRTAAALAETVGTIRTLAARQIAGNSVSSQSNKDKTGLFDDLWAMIRKINRAAHILEDENPGNVEKFSLPQNRSQQNLIAVARAFAENAAPLEAQLSDKGLSETFIADLQSLIDEIETSKTRIAAGTVQRAEATGGIIETVRRGTEKSRKLDSIIRLKYDDNPQKLAAWDVASHLESPNRAKKTAPTDAKNGTKS